MGGMASSCFLVHQNLNFDSIQILLERHILKSRRFILGVFPDAKSTKIMTLVFIYLPIRL